MMRLVSEPLLTVELPSLRRLGRGKVRELFQIGRDLLLVATDRVSAFDVVMQEGIPGKGRVLTALSTFWLQRLRDVVPNHLLSTDVDAWPELTPKERDLLRGRAMRCQTAEPLPVEWVVRGFLTGSGWKDYQRDAAVSGVRLPPGLLHAAELDPPILTPSTKAASGHDEPISFQRTGELVGPAVAAQARDAALELYRRARAYARERGVVIADTKFEFGLQQGRLLLIDECLTPDSSRFWPADEVRPGATPTSFDKQVLRNWLLQSGWNQQPPPPPLPAAIVAQTAATYAEIQRRLTA